MELKCSNVVRNRSVSLLFVVWLLFGMSFCLLKVIDELFSDGASALIFQSVGFAHLCRLILVVVDIFPEPFPELSGICESMYT